MSDCTVYLYCSPMAVKPAPDVGLLCHRTDAEPMVCTVSLQLTEGGQPQFSTIIIEPVTIPPTLSRPTGLCEWTVDACVGEYIEKCPDCNGSGEFASFPGSDCHLCSGRGFLGNRIRIELPKERVAFKWKHPEDDDLTMQNAIDDIFWETKDLVGIPFGLYAEPIDATCTLWLSDGRIFRTDPNVPDSFVRFGECRIKDPLFNATAEAITTTKGNLVLQ